VNFDLNEDEQMLKSLAERFVGDRYDGERRRAYRMNAEGFCPQNWTLMGELGLIATAFSTASGGMGSSKSELAVLCEALGRGLVVEPLIDSALVAGALFDRTAKGALHQSWIGDLVSGARRLSLAHRERAARGNPNYVETRATPVGEDWQLSGEKALVIAATNADAFIVTARTSDDAVKLFLLPAGTPGLEIIPYRLLDGSNAGLLSMRGVTLDAACLLEGGLDMINEVEARAAIARCAEALGTMDMLYAETLEYLRIRKQFGVPLGSFQALQHRMVAQYAAIEQGRALLCLAVMAEGDDGAATAGARAFISDASVALGHEMIQMHGGMGVSDELNIGHGHKRLMMLSRYPEDAAAALDRYAGVNAA
jgi:alkylation response protein AidB-like acyl-CoA dehydrogenase